MDGLEFVLVLMLLHCCHFTFAEHVFTQAHTAFPIEYGVCVSVCCIAAGACQMRFVAAIVNMGNAGGDGGELLGEGGGV